jgi:hypothetical protein
MTNKLRRAACKDHSLVMPSCEHLGNAAVRSLLLCRAVASALVAADVRRLILIFELAHSLARPPFRRRGTASDSRSPILQSLPPLTCANNSPKRQSSSAAITPWRDQTAAPYGQYHCSPGKRRTAPPWRCSAVDTSNWKCVPTVNNRE